MMNMNPCFTHANNIQGDAQYSIPDEWKNKYVSAVAVTGPSSIRSNLEEHPPHRRSGRRACVLRRPGPCGTFSRSDLHQSGADKGGGGLSLNSHDGHAGDERRDPIARSARTREGLSADRVDCGGRRLRLPHTSHRDDLTLS